MAKDVVMAEAASKKTEEVPATAQENTKRALEMLARGVRTGDDRWLVRPLRGVFALRRRLTREVVLELIVHHVEPNDAEVAAKLKGWASGVSSGSSSSEPVDGSSAQQDGADPEAADEIVMFVQLLVTMFLLDHEHFDDAVACVTDAVSFLEARSSRRTLFPLSAQIFYFLAVAHERVNKLAECRPHLLALFKTTSLHHNYAAHPVLVNAVLRSYLHYGLYEQADKFLDKITFREDAPSNQLARFYYYEGRIRALQLDYQRAHDCLLVAIRKSPRTGAIAFRAEVHRVSCIVQLLMGNVPDRAIFRQPDLAVALEPYYELTHAVRVGDLSEFQKVLAKHETSTFVRDGLLTLVLRVRNNVIKAGLRKIGLAYSRISFADIAQKLQLESSEDAEFVAAMAIRDGVVEGVVDHADACVRSRKLGDIYATSEVSDQYHTRIEACHNLHNEALRAMRYPPRQKKAANDTQQIGEDYIDVEELLEELEDEDEF